MRFCGWLVFLWPTLFGMACLHEGETPQDVLSSGALSLIDHAAWELVSEEDDVFDDRNESANCSTTGFGVEDGFFEVNTDVCQYATFRQGLLEPVHINETIRFVLWHSPLSSPEQATGHLALSIDGDVLWESNFPVPGPAVVYDDSFELVEAVEEGTPIYFHVHNHGNNSYRLGLIEKQE